MQNLVKQKFANNSTIIILLFFITLTFSTCIKKRIYNQCSGFNDSYFTLWFPYEKGQNLYFKEGNSSSIIDTFKISTLDKSNPYEQNAFNYTDSCHSSIEIQSLNGKGGYKLFIDYTKNKSYKHEAYNY